MFKRILIDATWQRAAFWAAIAGIAYYSWPLGYVLNPVAGRGMASDLEASGQPYNWVFILLDVTCGVLVILVAWWLHNFWRHNHSAPIKLILWGYALFGFLTAVDALLPLNCLEDQQHCGPVLSNPMTVLHGIASIGSILGLTLSILGIWQLIVVTYRSSVHLRVLIHTMLFVWLGFGILTLVLILLRRSSGGVQHIFITVCSLWTAILPFAIVHFDRKEMEAASRAADQQEL